jgi:hypothetical protein
MIFTFKNFEMRGDFFVKKFKKVLCSGLLVMLCFGLLGTNALAGGQVNTYIYPLASSGSSGAWSKIVTVNGGAYFEGCGRVTYNVEHFVPFGAWTSTSWKWTTSSYKITNLSGKVSGGVGFTGNYESTSSNVFDYKYLNTQIYANTTYSYSWNRTMALGPINKNAHYDVTTKSGFPNPSSLCDDKTQVVFDVGGRATISANTEQVIPLEFTQSNQNLSKQLGSKYHGKSDMLGKDSMVTQYDNDGQNVVLLTQQKDFPISINNIKDSDFVSENKNGLKYELGSFSNAEGTKMNVIRFKKKNIYMALVTVLSEEEALKIAEGL